MGECPLKHCGRSITCPQELIGHRVEREVGKKDASIHRALTIQNHAGIPEVLRGRKSRV